MDREQLIKELERFVILGDICYKHQLGFIADFIISYTEELRKENEELKRTRHNIFMDNNVLKAENERLKALVDSVEKMLKRAVDELSSGFMNPNSKISKAISILTEGER